MSFNSSMVRFGEHVANCFVNEFYKVSIPVWCDLECKNDSTF